MADNQPVRLLRQEAILTNGVKLDILHNLEDFGLEFESAVINWAIRTEELTEWSLCKYIMSKDPENIIAIPFEEGLKLGAEMEEE